MKMEDKRKTKSIEMKNRVFEVKMLLDRLQQFYLLVLQEKKIRVVNLKLDKRNSPQIQYTVKKEDG